MRRPKRLYRNIRLKFSSSLLVAFACVVLLTELIKRRQSMLSARLDGTSVDKVYTAHQVPGQFLRDALPSNESYCNYRFGLPSTLTYTADDVRGPPQLGASSPYRVLYHVINGTGAEQQQQQIPPLTYCTHMTPDYIYHLSEIVRFWEGPISATVFVPSVDAEISVRHLNRLCRCLPDMYRVSVHFVFPVAFPPTMTTTTATATSPSPSPAAAAAAVTDVADCTVPSLDDIVTYRSARSMVYPVNVGRNVARAGAQTRYVLVSDVELIPSEMLATKFLDMLRRMRYRRHDAKSAPVNYVFVVPVFEVEDTEQVPIRKSELKEMFDAGTAVYFHKWTCLHCQRFPALHRWLKRKSDSYVKPFLIVRREFPYHRWEPVYIGTNEEPLYSETLSWEGQQDKMTQMLEMCLLDYRFVILDGAFLVHRPGIKRRGVDEHRRPTSDTWRRPHERQNTKQYGAIIDALASKYVENKRCRLT